MAKGKIRRMLRSILGLKKHEMHGAPDIETMTKSSNNTPDPAEFEPHPLGTPSVAVIEGDTITDCNAILGLQNFEPVSTAPPAEDLKGPVQAAQNALETQLRPGERTEQICENIDQIAPMVNNAVALIDPLLEKVKAFVTLVDMFAEIHPYAKIASSILFSGIKVVIGQYERDQAMIGLLQAMDNTYLFVFRAQDLKDIDTVRKKLLREMSVQTIQCAYFIQDQAKFRSFWRRVAANAVLAGTEIDSKIKEFTAAFEKIGRCFIERTILEGEIRMVGILEVGLDMQTTVDLQQLRCIHEAGYDANKGCLAGTRVKTIDMLSNWVNTVDAPQVLFLLGGAGSGKSSIAHSMGTLFHGLGRLGSFLRFDRSAQKDRPLSRVIRTIARNLGNWDPAFRSALASAIHTKRELGDSVNIAEQWAELIVKPLNQITLVGPALLVIDAFDESGSERERASLLKTLIDGAKDLPANVHILITSRPERDVVTVLGRSRRDYEHINFVDLGDYEDEARADIANYVRHELAPQDPEMEQPLDEEDLQLLADKAEGLFQWAATACRRILESSYGMTLKECLDLMLQAGSSLDDLYRGILDGLFNHNLGRETVMERFRMVMAQILCASSPLSLESLEEMRGLATGVPGEVALIVRTMGSLLWGVHTQGSIIRPHHTSFRDFLLDESRSREWFVKLGEGHRIMVLGCVRVMTKRLSFNMCGLENSSVFNSEIDDLDARIAARIPQSLSYAAGNWQDHLPSTALPSDLQQELDTFLKEKLLFWFELLSLLGVLNRAAPALEAALAIYQPSTGESCKELLKDAIFFIRRYAVVVALSAVHVYLSALPFSPKSSLTRRTYIPHFRALPVVEGIYDDWPPICAVLSGHMDWVCAVAYSPDGRCIASGSSDKTVRVWDVETGATIHTLYCSSSVHGVAFSPDGYRIAAACGDRMVRVWDSTTGDKVCELVEGHERHVHCVAYSPNGNYLVTGGGDTRVCLWSTESHLIVRQLTHGGTVLTVAFSPTGRHLASGGNDRKVRVWNTDDGQPVGNPLEGHTGRVLSVLFSLDGQWIISGSDDATIRIWDIATQQILHTIYHPGRVCSLSLSPDGRRLVSGSHDGHVFVWNLETQRMVGEPLVRHHTVVCGVSFSPDGRHIVSGSADLTLRISSADANTTASGNVSPKRSNVHSVAWSPDGRRILTGYEDGSIDVWDASTGQCIRARLNRHTNAITCIRFSPSGSRFVTASDDGTLRVWDSFTLQPLGEPLHGHTKWVTGVDFSPDGSRIVSCSYDHTLRIWDVDTLQCTLGPLTGHESSVNCVAWSPDGTRIASGSNDNTVRLWDAQTANSVGQPFTGHEYWVYSVSWSSDGHFLMTSSGDGTIMFWDVLNGVPAGDPLHCKQGVVYCARYSLDGQRIVSAGDDIRMWDAQTREPVGIALSIPFKLVSFHDFEFSPDGRRFISRSHDMAHVWDMDGFMEPLESHPTFKNSRNPMDPVVYFTCGHYRGLNWDGWITEAGSRVMWLPEEYQEAVRTRGISMVLGHGILSIDFTNAAYGSEWHKCYRGP